MSLKRQLIIAIAAVSFLSILVAAAVVVPKIHKIQQMRTTIFETQKQLEKNHDKGKFLRRSLRELDTAHTFALETKSSAVDEQSDLTLITEFETLSEQFHIDQTLDASRVEIKKENTPNLILLQKAGITSFYKFSFLNRGTFQNHVAFLKALESLPYFVIIDSLQWEGPKGEQVSDDVTLRFDARVYIKN